MKKIGILHGKETTFPEAFVKRINEKKVSGIMAEAVLIDKVAQADPTDYAVIIDRISQDVPFYRAYLKNAAISGTAVLNNPFWWSADEKFFNNALAEKIGVAVPKTVILPSHERPEDTNEDSFRNLKFPMGWDEIFQYVGFPAYMKPHSGGGWKSVYRVNDQNDLWEKHAETGRLVMMLQEEIEFSDYFRCYYLGGDRVHIMQYEPRNPHHLRYVRNAPPTEKKLLAKVKEGVIKLNRALGYDFNTVEFAIRNGVPYAIDFCNPAPDADIHSVGEDNFEWVVENAANMAIERAKAHKEGGMNLTWGSFVTDQIAKGGAAPSAKRKPGRPRKTSSAATTAASGPKRKPGRPRKNTSATTAAKTGPKRKPGRPRKSPAPAIASPASDKPSTAANVTPTASPKKSTTARAPKKRSVTAKATSAPKRMMDPAADPSNNPTATPTPAKAPRKNAATPKSKAAAKTAKSGTGKPASAKGKSTAPKAAKPKTSKTVAAKVKKAAPAKAKAAATEPKPSDTETK